jgi:hypothetical protein
MPGQNYADVAAKLKAAGLPGETPCAVISRATTTQQRTHICIISELQRSPKLAAPTLVVVGEVVRFADPIALSQRFEVPVASAGNDLAVPEALLTNSLSAATFPTNEEPLA